MRRSLHQSRGTKVCFDCLRLSLQNHVNAPPFSVPTAVDNGAVYTLLGVLEGHISMADQKTIARDFRSNLASLSYNAHSKKYCSSHKL